MSDTQRMSIEINHESPLISARTLGEAMSNMNDLLIEDCAGYAAGR